MEPAMENNKGQNNWDEDTSKRYLNYGRYFVPAREQQMRIMVDLLKGLPQPFAILKLCCGEGLLVELILGDIRGATVIGLDGSQVMLEKAHIRLRRFTGRYQLVKFDLADQSWRKLEQPVQAVVSSLAVHHLEGDGKQALFRDVNAMLSPGGAFIIADMVEPATVSGRNVAADAWDEVVRQRSLEQDASTAAMDFFQQEGWNTYRYLDRMTSTIPAICLTS